MRVLFLTKYGRLGASSRLRSYQYIPYLNASGLECVIEPLLSESALQFRYRTGKYNGGELLRSYLRRICLLRQKDNFDLIWIEKEALPWFPASFEMGLLSNKSYVLDYDDAVFHGYDLHRHGVVRFFLGSRLDKLMSGARLVIGGNDYLAQRAIRAGAAWVEIMPTVIDLERYPPVLNPIIHSKPRIVWIGSPSTAHYLHLLRKPLEQLALKTPFVLRVIGAQGIEIPGVNVEHMVWTEDSEVDSIASCAVGIMPLEDSPWEKGKCGYKLIQYMACSLPVVASAVGANVEIVENGKSGYLVDSADEWVTALQALLESFDLRRAMGQNGRRRVEDRYCLQKTGPRLVELLRSASTKK